jgi:hypothetical protein
MLVGEKVVKLSLMRVRRLVESVELHVYNNIVLCFD